MLGLLNVAGCVASLAGLGVGIYTLSRVRRVAKAQAEERRITQELFGVAQIELDLRQVIGKLKQVHDQECDTLATDLSIALGGIQGVRRALDASMRPAAGPYVRVGHGFFSESFVIDQIDRAHRCIDIITGRTYLVAAFYVLDHIRQACDRGVQVRLVGLSEEADDAILTDAARTVSNPAPRDFAEYRQQIIENKATILRALSTWRPEAQAHFQYRTNKSVPRVSFLRADTTISLGFLQFYRDAQPAELREREYIEVAATSGLGQTAMKHFEIAWQDGIQILPRP